MEQNSLKDIHTSNGSLPMWNTANQPKLVRSKAQRVKLGICPDPLRCVIRRLRRRRVQRLAQESIVSSLRRSTGCGNYEEECIHAESRDPDRVSAPKRGFGSGVSRPFLPLIASSCRSDEPNLAPKNAWT